jgi:hypothetical protein
MGNQIHFKYNRKPFSERIKGIEYMQYALASIVLVLLFIMAWRDSIVFGILVTTGSLLWVRWHIIMMLKLCRNYITSLRFYDEAIEVEFYGFGDAKEIMCSDLENLKLKIALDNKRSATFYLEFTLNDNKIIQRQDDQWAEEKLWCVFSMISNKYPKNTSMDVGFFNYSKYVEKG